MKLFRNILPKVYVQKNYKLIKLKNYTSKTLYCLCYKQIMLKQNCLNSTLELNVINKG